MDSRGSIVDQRSISKPQISSPKVANLSDGNFKVSLDPDFYSDSKLKKPNDLPFPNEESTEYLDLLVSTKWSEDPSGKEKYQNFLILKNLLLEQLKTIPKEEMENIKKLYGDTLQKIDNFTSLLSNIQDGQSDSMSALKYETIFSDVYETGTGQNPNFSGLEGTKMLVSQALSDLGNIWGYYSSGNWFYQGNVGVNTTSVGTGTKKWLYNSSSGELIWIDFIKKLKADGHLPNYEEASETPRTGLINQGDRVDIPLVTKFNGQDVFSSDGKPKEWYYANFQKTLLGEDTNWDSLKDYLDTFRSTIESYEAKAKIESLGGGLMLVDQAIKKAILKLSMSNLDVTEYAPLDKDGNNFFAKIMRSGALGPSGVTPWPSKYSVDEEAYQVKPYTNTAFLCYHALLTIIKGVSKTASRQFLEENIKEPDSNHDKVIDLMIDTHSGTVTGSTSGTWPGSGSKNIKELLHLYAQGESFPITEDVILIPEEDSVPISERSFVQWYLKRIRNTTEHLVKKTSSNSREGYQFLKDDYSSSVKGSGSNIGKLDIDDLPEPYINMGYMESEDATNNMRLLKANYGIPKASGTTKDVLAFYKQRRYSMPYFWASMTSLWRAITVEVWKNLIDSVNDIADTEIAFSKDEIIQMFDHGPLWMRIRALANNLIEENGIEFRIYSSVDGTLNFVEKNAEAGSLANSVRYRNTPGLNTRIMLQSYVKFVSMVSDHKSVEMVDDHKAITFDTNTYLPPEALSLASNQNYANNHGGSSQYIEDTFADYFDKLEFTHQELNGKLPIKKSKSPIGEDIGILNSRYSAWLERNQRFFQHIQMFQYIISAFSNLEKFVDGFSVPEKIKSVFIDGEISIDTDLEDPNNLKIQIASNKEKYLPNEFGLGKRWEWNDFDLQSLVQKSKSQGEGWLYIQVLGLKKNMWGDLSETIKLVPEYITPTEPILLRNAMHEFGFENEGTLKDKTSDEILKYIHLTAGIDISELSFSKNLDMIYSPLLIESESGIFPWEKGDFEEGKPTKPLETLYNMSPLLFPQNLFNDICIPNEYHRVVACVITRRDVQEAGISLEEVDGNIDDIIGSLRWKWEK